MAAFDAPAPAAPPRGGVRWALVGWIFVMSAVAYLDRVNISIAGKAIAGEFHLSNVELGYIFSAFLVGYALCQAPGGRLADRWGPRRVLTLGVLWWGVFTALTAAIPGGLVAGLALFVLVRFLLGCGEAVVYPASNRMVASWIPVSERGIANGVIFAGVGIGAGVTPPLIAYVMHQGGWRWSFWISALIGFAAGGIWFWLARDRPSEHPWVKRPEADWIAAGLDSRPAAARMPWRVMLGDRNVRALSISYFTFGYSAYIFFSWFFLYLMEVRGLNLKSSALYGMLPFLAMAVGSPLGGWISDVTHRRYGARVGRLGIAVVGMLLAALFILLGSRAGNAGVASVILAGGAGALYLSQSSFWSVTADVGGASAGAMSGVMNMSNQIGGAITASLTPALAGWFGWDASFAVAAALCVLGAVAWLAVDPRRPLPGR